MNSEFTDVSRFLNATPNQNLIANTHADLLAEDDENAPEESDFKRIPIGEPLINQQLHEPATPNSQRAKEVYLSPNLQHLKILIETENRDMFEECLSRDIVEPREAMLYLYAAVNCFHSERVFYGILERNNRFEMEPDKHILFLQPNIYRQLLTFQSSIEKCKFNLFALEKALESNAHFMTEYILSNALLTKEMIGALLQDDQKSLMLSLLSMPTRPMFL